MSGYILIFNFVPVLEAEKIELIVVISLTYRPLILFNSSLSFLKKILRLFIDERINLPRNTYLRYKPG